MAHSHAPASLTPCVRMRGLAPERVPSPKHLLPAGILVEDVADLSRHALVSFLELASIGAALDRAALTSWLFGPYLDAISIGSAALDVTAPTLVFEDDGEPDVTARVAATAASIAKVLRAFAAGDDPSAAERLVGHGVVEMLVDERGSLGYGPRAESYFPLSVRVLSVTAVELLARPERLRADLVLDDDGIRITERPVMSGVAFRSRQTHPYRSATNAPESSPGWPERAPTLDELVREADAGWDD